MTGCTYLLNNLVYLATATAPALPKTAAAPSEPELIATDAAPAADEDPLAALSPNAVLKLLSKKLSLGTTWYLAYGFGNKDNEAFNEFRVTRGYVTMKLKATSWLQARVSLDSHQDDTGDFKVRLKYLYARFTVPVETFIITNPAFEFGIAHGPWLHYEEDINRYRMRGKMFLERNGLFNSADLGGTITGLLGPKLPKEYQETVSKHAAGRYGSFALGLYNGGGYHAREKNENKVFIGRLSLRPLFFFHPNLQASYLVVAGAGNTVDEPAWEVHNGMLSYEHPYVVTTVQVGTGRGNQKGNRVDANGEPLVWRGASGFLEVKLPWIWSSVFGSYDWFDWDGDGSGLGAASSRLIGGWAFWFYGKNAIVADVEQHWYHRGPKPSDWEVKLTLQVKL